MLVWCSVVATSFVTLEPAFVGMMIDELALSSVQAGILSATLLAAGALGNLLLVSWIGRPLRPLVLASGATIFLTELASSLAPFGHLLLAFRLLNAFAAGVLFGAINAYAARTKQPNRLFAEMLAAQLTFGAVALYGMPLLLDRGGLRLVFLAFALLCLPIAASLRVLTPDATMSVPATHAWRTANARIALLLTSLLLMYTGATAIWAFLERIGIQAGLPEAQIRMALSGSMIAGLFGCGLAWLMAARMPCQLGVLIGLCSMVAGIMALLLNGAAAFATGAAALNFGQVFAVPSYLSLLARGPEGQRDVVIAGPAISAGLILGPLVGTALMARAPGPLLSIGSAALILLALALLLPLWSDRRNPLPA